MTLRQPDSEFVDWLNRFDPELRVRWNPQRHRWVIDERNRKTGHWQCILVWEDDKHQELPLNHDLAFRLQLMRHKYNQLIVSPDDYIRELQANADFQQRQQEEHAAMERRGLIAEEISQWRQAFRNMQSGIL